MGSVAIGTLIFVREADMKMAASGRYALLMAQIACKPVYEYTTIV